jgi:hypothetical protein
MMLAAVALALAPAGALAQSAAPQAASPEPAASSAPSGMSSPVAAPVPRPSAGGTISTSPEPAASPASSGSGSSGSGAAPNGNGGPSGHAAGKIKSIKSGTLSFAQVSYALTHPLQEANQLKKMKKIDFDKLRVYKLPSSLKGALKVSAADTQAAALAVLGPGVQIAQTTPNLPTTNGNNSPIQYLRDVLANINVSNALNNLNVLNNSNVNVDVALSNVLNNNKISIGQVVGLYIGGGGIITTITK